MAPSEALVIRTPVACLGMVLWAGIAGAQTPVCDGLSGASRQLAERILASEHPYACCDDTIARCLEARPRCSLAARLADNVCRRAAAGQDEARIRRALSRRARSMLGGGASVSIDLAAAPSVGPDDAAVTVVVYACARCPYCSHLVPALYEAVTAGWRREEVRLVFRVFPIRGHEGSTAAGLGFVAAARMDAFWPFMLHAYRSFDAYSADRQIDWAEAVGLERAVFEAQVADPQNREALVESKKEGLRNGVEETPTVFINGRRWVGDLEIAELLDAIDEEAATARGEIWLGE